MREIISQRAAAERGLLVFYTGTRCKRAGHLSARRIKDGICIKCMIAVMRERMKPNPKPLSLSMHPARVAAEKAGQKTFTATGYACVRCKGLQRFVGGRINCVKCQRARNAKNREAA